jgi:hypothetical protein
MDAIERGYETAPRWLIGILFLAGLILARELGAWLRRRVHVAPEADDREGFLVGAVLSLLALLIAFTFSMALQRYDQRRELVIVEANALGTAWLRADLLDAPDRDRVRAALRTYIDARVEYGHARARHEEVQAQRRSEALQGVVWRTTMEALEPHRTTPLAALVVTATNDAIDAAGERFATHLAHIPPRIFRMLAVYALMAAGMVGYQRAAHRKATTLMFVLLALAVSLVIDLDRPASGMITIPQQPMLDLQRSLGR